MPTKKSNVVTKTGKAAKPVSEARLQQWADKINGQWLKATKAILETGNNLIAAQKEIPHGQWLAFLDDSRYLTFDKRKAQRLMQIARHPIFVKASHVTQFPASYSTLAVLVQLPEVELKQLIKDGDIHPNMERKDAEELVTKVKEKGEGDDEAETPKAKSKLIKDDVEDLEPDDSVEEPAFEDDEEDEPAPKTKGSDTPKGIVRDKPGKSSKDFALENFGSGIGSLDEYCKHIEKHFDDDDHLPKELIDEAKQLIKKLTKIINEYK